MSTAAARRAGGESSPCAGRVSRNGTPAKPMTGKGDSLLRGVGRKSGRLCVQFARPWSRSSAGTGGQNGWDAAGACGVRDSSLLAGGEEDFLPAAEAFSLFLSPAGG